MTALHYFALLEVSQGRSIQRHCFAVAMELERAGLVTFAGDGLSISIILTEKGRAALAEATIQINNLTLKA